MMRERFNGGQATSNPRYTPKARKCADGYSRPTYSASRVLRAVHLERDLWEVERMEDGEYHTVGCAERIRNGLISGYIWGNKPRQSETVSGLLDLLEET